MNNQQSSYGQFLRGIAVFGGVQIFIMIISIIRSKIIAVLLGTLGMGIYGMLTSTTSIISGLTNFGLSTSAIRDVSAANIDNNEYRISKIVCVLRRLIWVTGLLGMALMLILSPILSELAFGNKKFTLHFVWISFSLLINQLSSGQIAILQGLRKISYLAKANLYGSAIGLLITVPIYYRFGINGIVPAIIVSSIIALTLSSFYGKKLKIRKTNVTPLKTYAEGKNMLVMGFLISMSGLITLLSSFIIRAFISNNGSIEQVGLYAAGFTIINTYVGMIFTAMGTDYFPRLTSTASNNILSSQIVNQQGEIAILIMAPLLVAFLIFIKWAILLLYSEKFLSVDGMLHWAALGIFFKTVGWVVAFLFLAKGHSKTFFWNELIFNIYALILNVICFKEFGITGLGMSFLITYIMYSLQVLTLCFIKYQFTFRFEFLKIFSIQIIIAISSLILMLNFEGVKTYLFGLVFIIFSSLFSLFELNKRIDLRSIFKRAINRFL